MEEENELIDQVSTEFDASTFFNSLNNKEEEEEEEEIEEILSGFGSYEENLGQILGREKYPGGPSIGGPIIVTPPEDLEEQANFYRQYLNPYPGVNEEVASIVENVIGADWVKEQRDRIKKQPDFLMNVDPFGGFASSEDQPTEGEISGGSMALGQQDVPRYSGGGEYIKVNQLKAQIENIDKTLTKLNNPNIAGYDRAVSLLTTEKQMLEELLNPAKIQADKDFKRNEEKAFSTGKQAWKELEKSVSSNMGTMISNLVGLPDTIIQSLATMGMSDEELEKVNEMPPDLRADYLAKNTNFEKLFPGVLKDIREHRKKIDKGVEELNKTVYQFEDGIGETFGDVFKNLREGKFVEGWENAMQAISRTSSGALAQIPNFIVAATPTVGLPALGLSTVSGEMKEKQDEAYDAKRLLDQLSVTDPDYDKKRQELMSIIERGDLSGNLVLHSTVSGAAEILFERFSGKLLKKAFLPLKGAPKPVVEDAFKAWGLNMVKQAGGEGLSETGTLLLQKMSEQFVLGNEEAFEDSLQEFVDNFIIGAAAGGQITFAGTTPGVLKQLAVKNRVNKILQKNNISTIERVYNPIEVSMPEVPNELKFPVITEASIELSQLPGVKEALDNSVDIRVKKGELTTEQANEVKVNFRDTQSAVNQLKPVGLNLNVEAVGLVVEKKKLEEIIKSVNDKALTQNQQNRIDEINNTLGDLVIEQESQTQAQSIIPGEVVDKAKGLLEKAAGVKNIVDPDLGVNIPVDQTVESDGINETLLETIKDPQASKAAQNQAQQALINNNQNLYLEAVRFSPEAGTIPRNKILEAINSRLGPIINNFDPSKGVTWSTYVTNSLKPKMQEIYNEAGIGRRGTSLDTEGAMQVPDTQVETDITQEIPQRDKVYPAALEVITENITPEVRSEQTVKIKDDINRAVATESTSPKVVAKSIVKQTQTPAYRKLIKDKLGKWNSDQYNNNVDRLVTKDFIATIPIAQIKRRFGKLFNIQQTGTTPTTKIENGKRTDFKKPVYKIPAITDAQLETVKDYFKANEKRQQSLYSLLGEGIAIEQMQELKGDQQFMTDLQGRLELKGSNLTAEQFIDEVESNLDKRNLEDTSLDVVEDTVDSVVKNMINENNVDSVKADALSKAISKLETFRKTNLSMNALTGVVEAGLRTLRAARNAGRSLASALKDFTKSIKDFIKKPTVKKPKLTIKDIQKIGNVVKSTVRQLANTAGYDLYPAKKKGEALSNGFSAEQKRNRDESVIRNLDNFGTAFFLNTKSWADSGRSIFNKRVEQNINELTDLSKTSLFSGPKYGKIFTEQDFNILKEAEAEQAKYAKMKPEKRKALLKDKKFIEIQENKSKVLKKIIDGINTDIRDSNGKIIKERLEFWATWLNTQGNISTHPMRVLAPIKFFSTNNQLDSTAKNFVAEHTLPSSNATKVVLEMLINNSVNKDFKFLKDNYTQGQLLKTDDDIIALAGYRSQLPSDFFSMDKPNTWVRYLLGNPEINLNEYVTYKDGEIVTIAESLGLGLSKANQNPDNINMQNNLLVKVFKGETTINKAKKELEAVNKTNKKSSKQVNNNKEKLFDLIKENSTTEQSIVDMGNADKAARIARDINAPTKGISVFDFDDTLAYSNSKVIVNMPNGKTRKITPAEFAIQSENLLEQGAEFDFSEFNKVVEGRKGPLADLALKRQEKFGSGDIFVLTARPQASAVSIKAFLDGIGLNIPLKNITGLENGSPNAKALWVLDKAAKGYNDFYFADDALPNVQAVKNILDQIDVKSDIQQAKANKVKDLDKEFNVIIEQQSGKQWYKTYSKARAKTTGRKVGRFEFFIPPSAEDFSGLLYKILPKGEKGNLAKKWFKDNLFDPFNKAEQELISAKITVAKDFQALRENIDNIPKNLNKPVGVGDFTHSQALRVYIWNMQGMEIPGISTRDLNSLVEKIENNADLKVFAEKIAFIQKGKPYPAPGENWIAGNITSDIIQSLNKAGRKQFLQEWQQNVDIIFSDKNLNKLEALYGKNYIIALKNVLGRMKSGTNRPVGANPQVNALLDWLNNSVGAVMFLNMRSAGLQLISSVNFMNWSDNNPFAAAKAFANQKQYWSDVMTLLNSDYLVQRRNGLKINVAESEIAEAARKGGMRGAIAYLLNKGFVLTRFADSMAIASGGATFYRNRVNKLIKQVNIDTGKLYTKQEAETLAFEDFYQISEESQQSSRTDRISMQQASGIGRLILNFANTPMQYARIMKKSAMDLKNGRGDWKTNVSKIVYYGIVQNLIFNAMQQAIFALAYGSDDEEERTLEDRAGNIADGMVSSLLRGLGYGGAAVDTVKDVIASLVKQGAKKSPKYEDAVSEVFNFSPAIDSKVRKLRSALKSFSWNMGEMKRRGFSIDNPAYLAVSQIISATTNVPLDRAARITMNIRQALDRQTEVWQKVALMFGYSGWELGLPYWGLQTTIDKEDAEDEAIKVKYKKDATELKSKGYKRIPMTKGGKRRGKPDGKLGEDYITLARPTGEIEYWLTPENTD